MNKKYRIYYRFFQYLLIMVLFIVFYKCKITAKAATANDVVSLANSQVGIGGCPNKYTKDLGPIGGSYDYYWCHAFVSWVAKYAGAGDIIPRTASCEVGVNWFKARERWRDGSSGYIPRPGDIIYFDWHNGGIIYDHVGIVLSVSNGRVHTIEGNANNLVKVDGGYSNGYALGSNVILGYGVPEYSTILNNPTGNFELVEGSDGKIRVQGWAYDPDDPSQSIDVHVYVGGPCSDTNASCYILTANGVRSDVNSEHNITGNHGFSGEIYTPKRGEKDVYVYGINIGSGDNSIIRHVITTSYAEDCLRTRITEPYQSGRTIPDGDYQIVTALDHNKCIDLNEGSSANGTKVAIHTLNGGLNQVWHVEYLSEGYYRFINKMSDTALDVPEMSSEPMTNLKGQEKNNSYAQQWIIKPSEDGEHYYITSKCNGLNMDVLNADTTDSLPIVVNGVNTTNAERWKFVRMNDPVGALDVIEGHDGKIRLKGWAYDPDQPLQSLDMKVYIGGSSTDAAASCYVIKANVDRQDVNQAYNIEGKHGYLEDVVTALRGEQEIYVYAVNVGSGEDALVGHMNARITEPNQKRRTIPDGDYQIVSALDNSKCIDLYEGSADNGAKVEIQTRNGGHNQIWHVEYISDGYYRFINKMSGTALDVPEMSSERMTRLKGQEKNDSYAQQWLIKEADDGEHFYITSKCNGLNIDVLNADTTDADALAVNYVNTSDAERWRFIACTDEGQMIPDGDYHILSFGETDYGLDLRDKPTENGSSIGIGENTNDDDKIITVKYLENGYYTLKNKLTGMALEVAGCKGHNDQEVTVHEYNGTDAQQWMIGGQRYKGSYTIRTKCGGFYVEADLPPSDLSPDSGAYAKTTLQSDNSHSQYGVSGVMQSWVFIPVEEQKLEIQADGYDVTFLWNKLTWAEKYDVVITDENGKSYSQYGLEDTALECSLPDGTYTAFVKSANRFYSSNSKEITFTVEGKTENSGIEDVFLSDAAYTYNGKPQVIRISGKLPEGISVIYKNNGRTEAGTYMVQAKLVEDSTGNIVDIKSAKMTILPLELSELKVVAVEPQAYTGIEVIPSFEISASVSGTDVALTEKEDYTVRYENNVDIGTAAATISLCGNYSGTRKITYQIVKGNNEWKTPLSVRDTVYGLAPAPKAEAIYGEVAYQYSDSIDGEYSAECPAEVGTYYVKAYVPESEHYSSLESEPVSFSILQGEYMMNMLRFENREFVYDGKAKTLEIEGTVPSSVQVNYTGNGQTDVGTYTVTAKFTGDSSHKAIPDMTAELTILPVKVMIPESRGLIYTGNELSVLESNEMIDVVSGATGTEIGTYEMVLALKDVNNSVWVDGTTGNQTVKWEIVNGADDDDPQLPDETDIPEAEATIENPAATEQSVTEEKTTEASQTVSEGEQPNSEENLVLSEEKEAEPKTTDEKKTEEQADILKPEETTEPADRVTTEGKTEKTRTTQETTITEDKDTVPVQPDEEKKTLPADQVTGEKSQDIPGTIEQGTSTEENREDNSTSGTQEKSAEEKETQKPVEQNTQQNTTESVKTVPAAQGSTEKAVQKSTQAPSSSSASKTTQDDKKAVTKQTAETTKQDEGLDVGDTVEVGICRYTVTDDGEVAITGITNNKAKKVTIPDMITVQNQTFTVTEISDGSFANSSIVKVAIGNNVKTIGASAFKNCKKLSSVTMGKNVETIGKNAFKNCKALKKIVLPESLEEIDNGAFSGCKKLANITIKSSKLLVVEKNAFKGIKKTAKIKVPGKKLSKYKKLLKNKGQSRTVEIRIK